MRGKKKLSKKKERESKYSFPTYDCSNKSDLKQKMWV